MKVSVSVVGKGVTFRTPVYYGDQ